MGLYDRDYYRREGPSFLGSITETGRMCKTLIIINAVVFIFQFVTATPDSLGPLTENFWLKPSSVMHGQVWQLLTHAFLHSPDTLWHIVFNMLFLWWFGTAIEDLYGPKEFLALYLVAAVGSGLLYLIWSLVRGFDDPALGASGAVSAIFVLYACHYPRRIIYIFFVIPCPVWLLAVLYIGSDLLALMPRSGDGGGVAHAGHVGGALIGFLYYHSKIRLLNFVPDFQSWRKRRPQTRLRVYRGDPEPDPITPVSVPAVPPPARSDLDEHLEAKLDAVLEKVARVGKENLSDSEREILLRASELYRRRRT